MADPEPKSSLSFVSHDAVRAAKEDLRRGKIDALGYVARIEQALEVERLLMAPPQPIKVVNRG